MMKSEPGQTVVISLGNGRLFSRTTLTTWRKVVLARSLVLDWAKGRLLLMVLTGVVLIIGLGGILSLAFPGLGQGTGDDNSGPASALEEVRNEDQASLHNDNRLQLRDDLFDVPKPARKKKSKEPRTNPVELLRLIELQGILGGSNPRAMVLYKRNKESVTVSVGDDLGEFEVMEIRERSVVLKWRDELFELSL